MSANQQLQCNIDDLGSEESAVFQAQWCEECTAESLKSTTCNLITDNGICEYSGGCKGSDYGYDSATLVNPGTAHMACSAINYPITYYPYDGINDPENPSSYTVEDTVVFKEPRKVGFSFTGWFNSAIAKNNNDPEGIVQRIDPGTRIGPLALHAGWTENRYNLTYNCANENNDVYYFNFKYNDLIMHNVPRVTTNCSYPGFESNGWKCIRTEDNVDVSTSFAERANIQRWQIDSDVICTAQWSEKSYNIVYKEKTSSGDVVLSGNNLQPTTYTYSELPLIVDAEPDDRIGYDFDGWCTSKTKENCSLHPVVSKTDPQPDTTTFWADWKPAVYHIDYMLSGGVNDEENPSSYTIEDNIELGEAYKEGYTFEGWALRDPSGNIPPVEETNESEEYEEILYGWEAGTQYKDKVLYAVWQQENYNITYHYVDEFGAQWGENENHPSEYTVTSGTIVIGAPTRTGYEFKGWCEDAALTQNCVMHPTIPTGSYEDRDFYAQWEPIEYNINYKDLDGGTWDEYENHPETYTIEYANIVIDDPSKPGYTFDGWCDKPDNSCEDFVKPYEIAEGSYGDVDLYAHWVIDAYNITYETDDGVFETTPKTTYSVIETFTLDNPSKPGYEFKGWCDSEVEECEGEEETEKIISAGTTGDLVFYAQWEPAEYNVDYMCSVDDENAAITEIVEYGDSYEFRSDNSSNEYGKSLCEKTGYSFTGWQCSYKDSNNNSVSVPLNDIASWNILYNVQCLPVWSENSFTISFRPNSYYVENASAMADMTCMYEAGCVLTANQYVYPGFEFVGWKISNSEDATVYPNEATINHQTTNIILDAQWDKSKTWCNAGTYLARGTFGSCTECKSKYYCPYSREYEYNSVVDQGIESCRTLMGDSTATSLPGASRLEDCYVPCTAQTGYTLKSGHDVIHYPADDDECVSEAIIVYNGNTSCSSTQQTYEYSETGKVQLCVPDVVPGKTFMGWVDNIEQIYSITNNPTLSNVSVADFEPQNGYVTMNPVWNIEKYTLTYNCGSNQRTILVDDLEYNSEEVLIDYSECENPGYTFNGWICDNDDTSLDAGETLIMPNKNVVCDANIEENEYKIRYDGNGAEGTMPDTRYINYTETYTLDDNRFTYDGYTFDGWCTELDTQSGTCSGITYSNMQNVYALWPENEGVVTLYALWAPIRYTITYILPNDAVVSPANPKYYYVTTETFTLNNPTINGYEFLGWCDSNDVCSLETSIVKGTTGNLTFYIKTSAETYNIHYKYVNENKAVIDLPGIEPSTYTITEPVEYPRDINIPGYIFKDWYTGSNLKYKTYQTSTNTYSDITVYAKVEKISCPVNQFMQEGICVDCAVHSHSNGGYATTCDCDTDYEKVSGECIAKEYNINYDYKGGAPAVNDTNPRSYTIETQETSLTSPTKEGSEFVGWYLNSSFIGSAITSVPSSLKNDNGIAFGDVTLYAKWKELSCKTNYFIENNTCVPCGNHSHSAGGKVTTCECDEGYSDNDGACNLVTYTITYVDNGGELPTGVTNPTTYTVETSPIVLQEPVKPDYTFVGWYKNSNLTGTAITIVPNGMAENLTLYAGWAHSPCAVNQYLQNDSCVSCPANSHSSGGFVTECICNDGYEKVDGVCSEKEYTITYVYNGGTEVPNPTTYKVSDEPVDLIAPVKENNIFAGWYLTSRFSGNAVVSIPGNLVGNKTLYAKWQKNQGTNEISFDCTNENVITRSGYVGSSIAVPTNTECQITLGELTGWNCNGIEYTLSDTIKIPLEDITCDAIISYADVEFNIIYKAFDKNNSEIDMSFVRPNKFVPSVGVSYPTNIEIAGYDFKGWYSDSKLKRRTLVTPTNASSDVTVYAKLEIKKIHCDAGTYLPANATTCSTCEENKYCVGGDYDYSTTETQGMQDCNTQYPYSAQGATSGNRCYKYCEEREHYDYNSLGKQYQNGLNTCEYVLKPYHVYFVLNGGEFDDAVINPYEYTIDTPNITLLPVPSKTDKIFAGWKDADNNIVNMIDTSQGKDITLYAQWKSLPCAKNNYYVNDSCVACPDNMISNGGYATECDCKTGYNKTAPTTCEPIVYNIIYKGLEGVSHFNPLTYTINDYGLEFLSPNIRSGYTFAGWSRNGQTFNKIPNGITGDITVSANWSDLICGPNQFIEDGVCVQCGDHSHSIGGRSTGCTCDKGYETLFDVCVVSEYIIDYEYNGGTMPEGVTNPISYTVETPKTQLNEPVRPNYVFDGWYDNPEFTGNRIDYVDSTIMSGNVTLYAKWIFECESGKWLRIGDSKVCMYTEQKTHPAVAVDMNGVTYYIMLSDDSELPLHDGTTYKMHVEYDGKTYNAYDASVE